MPTDFPKMETKHTHQPCALFNDTAFIAADSSCSACKECFTYVKKTSSHVSGIGGMASWATVGENMLAAIYTMHENIANGRDHLLVILYNPTDPNAFAGGVTDRYNWCNSHVIDKHIKANLTELAQRTAEAPGRQPPLLVSVLVLNSYPRSYEMIATLKPHFAQDLYDVTTHAITRGRTLVPTIIETGTTLHLYTYGYTSESDSAFMPYYMSPVHSQPTHAATNTIEALTITYETLERATSRWVSVSDGKDFFYADLFTRLNVGAQAILVLNGEFSFLIPLQEGLVTPITSKRTRA